eukprot:TRINITY_DN90431_c0_g1_i1.p1 TRINITY_DN90431_c0_g1~~TRINITY_DN90431_c0_g1_i1.p1  ORF type:complete len:702 (-),score=93.86 TRINITY_DN90431_c0_g1_i1:172-2277(-)
MKFLLAVVMMPACLSQTSEDVKFMESQLTGCFHKGYGFSQYIPNTNINTTSIQLCQQHCQKTPECVKFAYFAWRGECWFADANAIMKPIASSYVLAGYRTCTPDNLKVPDRCTSELPSDGFPGASTANSNQAWKGGQQPAPGECWPTWWNGQPLNCNQVKVLEDTTTGWPGKCRGLVEMKSINGTDCEANCRSNPSCQSYQNSVYYSCWQGLGFDCFVRDNFAPRDAKRIMRGNVRKLMDLKGWQIVGLYKVFDNAEGFFTDDQTAIMFCKHVCYSDIRCEYWSYAPKFGCWVQDASQEYGPAYPLTLKGAVRDSPFALDSVAGEYIQHYCNANMVSHDIPKTETYLRECAEKGVRYDPPDMALQSRTTVSTYEACRQRCKDTLNCVYFAWWPDGGCHITDEAAQRVPAEDWGVISGPVDCSKAYTSTSPHPESWLNRPSKAPAPASEASPLLHENDVRVAEIAFGIHNLDISKASIADRNRLESKYAEAIANALEIPVVEVRDSNGPNAMKGKVKLVAGETTGRRLFTSSSETLVTAYTPNQPPNSEDTSLLSSKLKTAEFVELVKTSTTSVLPEGSAAITGSGIAITAPEVGTEKYPLQAFKEARGTDFWSQWWPLVVSMIVVCCACLACIFHRITDREKVEKYKQMKQARERGASMGSVQSEDDFEENPRVWAQAPPEPQHILAGHRPQPGQSSAFGS